MVVPRTPRRCRHGTDGWPCNGHPRVHLNRRSPAATARGISRTTTNYSSDYTYAYAYAYAYASASASARIPRSTSAKLVLSGDRPMRTPLG